MSPDIKKAAKHDDVGRLYSSVWIALTCLPLTALSPRPRAWIDTQCLCEAEEEVEKSWSVEEEYMTESSQLQINECENTSTPPRFPSPHLKESLKLFSQLPYL